jgi:hypothetical protein
LIANESYNKGYYKIYYKITKVITKLKNFQIKLKIENGVVELCQCSFVKILSVYLKINIPINKIDSWFIIIEIQAVFWLSLSENQKLLEEKNVHALNIVKGQQIYVLKLNTSLLIAH